MSQLRFDEFTKAYRETLSDELDSPSLLRRIHGTIRQRDERRFRSRWVTWLGSMGITTALGATLAYAAPLGRSWVDWMSELATISAPSQLEGPPGARGASEVSPLVTATELSGVSLSSLATDERALNDERALAREHSVPSQPSRYSSSTVRRSTTGSSTAGRVTAGRVTAGRVTEPVRKPSVRSEQSTDVQSLYGEAQRLQFVERDFVAAVLAWDRYLDESHDAVLRPGAEYHRAVCLVHLKRYYEARVELTRLTGPDASPAYRSRAATLLHSLAAAWQ